MTHIEQAIREAVKAGWEDDATADGFLYSSREPQIFLDPAFWQALGKARRWEDHALLKNVEFIKHLHDGKDAESFFAELFKP